MLLVVAKDQWLIQNGVGNVGYFTDPIPLGKYDRVSMHLLVSDLTTPSVPGNVALTMQPQVANSVSLGFVDAGSPVSVGAASATPSTEVSSVVGACLRFEFRMTVVTDAFQFKGLFDAHVLLDKA